MDLIGRDNDSQVTRMSRQRAFTVLALSALLLPLTACGGTKPASHAGVRVGSVVHIGRYTQVFGTPLPANPAQAAVVEGFREGEVLWEKSENGLRLVPSVREYVTGQALTHLTAAVKAGKTRHLVPAGEDRLFNTRVSALTGHSATVTTCDDGSKFKQVNPRTGKVDVRFLADPGTSYLFETWRMVQLSGHWAIGSISLALLPSPSAEPCQPGMAGFGPVQRPNVAALLREMTAALRAAASVHISGTISQRGQTLSLDLGLTRAGEFSGQVSEKGAVFTVLGTHGQSYLKVNAAFLRIASLPAADCPRFCGKYFAYPAAQSHELLAHLSVASLTHSLASTPARKVKYLGEVTTGGQLAWLLQDSHRNSIYVAARGKPYVLREVAASMSDGSVDLTQWNEVRIPGPPPASQVVTPSQLAG
jgi:hypothetical protein